jgi:phage-related baseplate assembly protein
MSLSTLPEITFCETDADTIIQSAFTVHEGITGKKLYPGDPERLFIEALLYIIIQQRQAIDYAGKMNLLGYSAGDFLDHLGVFTDTARLDAQAATVTMQFSLAAARAQATAIPAGTRVTPDGSLFYAVTTAGEIAAGQTTVELTAECATAGTEGNGYLAGQITTLVDPIDYVTAVANTTASTGGADIESDDAYRERIQLSPEKFSTAGPEQAYIYWAKTAHQDIIDVAVYMASAGVVAVHPLMTGGQLPDQDILDAVDSILSERLRRPLTDQVVVSAPTAVSYNIDLTYYVNQSDEVKLATIQENVAQAVADYRSWQSASLGRDINPDELVSLLKSAGVERAPVTAPVFTVLTDSQVAQEGTVTVTYGGLEDE